MKKILYLILLLPLFINAQSSDATPLENIVLLNNIKDNLATRVIVQDSITKELKWVLKGSIKSPIAKSTISGTVKTTTDVADPFVYNTIETDAKLLLKEDKTNKQNSLTADGTNTKYPTVTAVNTGLAGKQNTISGTANVVPKYGTGGLVASNFSDSGTLTSSSTDMSINSLRVGRGAGNSTLNVTMGTNSLISNTSGTNNLAIGSTALRFNTTGVNNTAIGGRSLEANISGINNLGVGFGTILFHQTGSYNIGIGSSSLGNVVSGDNNIGIGFASLFNMTSGSSNTAIGESAGRYIANGSSSATSIDNSTFIGYRARPNDNGQTNQLVAGYDAVGLGSNTSVYGNVSTQYGRWWGNMLLGTSSNNGRRLQVVGGADIDNLVLTTTPTTSTGTPPVLTRNPTTGAVESVPYSTFTSASNSVLLTGSQTVAGVKSMSDLFITNAEFRPSGGILSNKNAVFTNYDNTSFNPVSITSSGSAVGLTIGMAGTGTTAIRSSGGKIEILGAGNEIQVRLNENGTILQTTYTVATLPTGTLGMFAVVTDALAPTYLGTLVGGGSVKCPVFHNGTAWISH